MNLNASVFRQQHGSCKCHMQEVFQGRAAAPRDGLPHITFAKSALAPWPWPVGGNHLSSASHLRGKKRYRPFRSPCDILWVILGNRQEAIQVQVQSQGRCSLPGLEAKEKCKMKPLSGTHHESLSEQPGNVLQKTMSLLSAYGKEASRIQKNREMESKKKKKKILSFCQQSQMEYRRCTDQEEWFYGSSLR